MPRIKQLEQTVEETVDERNQIVRDCLPKLSYLVWTSTGQCYQNLPPVPFNILKQQVLKLLRQLKIDELLTPEDYERQLTVLDDAVDAYKERFKDDRDRARGKKPYSPKEGSYYSRNSGELGKKRKLKRKKGP